MSILLAAAALTTGGLLPVPLLPPHDASPPSSQVQQVEVSATLEAADGRLKKGCKDYRFTYSATTPTVDWSFDITLQDRHGRGVSSQSLIGPNDSKAGVLTYRLCRGATVPGLFTFTGRLVSYDGAEETPVTVTETFRLRRRNP